MQKKLLSILFGCLSFLFMEAAHIVGGDMYYECLGNDNYRITLKIYRDCNASGPNVAGFDNPAYIAIYDASGFVIEVVESYLTFGPTNIPPETQNPCLQAPANVCVEEGIFSFDRNLPASSGGYDIVYIRCCRNATILNIVTPDEVGATYTVHIPGSGVATCNSSPYFADFPPIVICVNEAINFDHSAIDDDGDSLVYSLCTPYTGATSLDPQPYPSSFLTTFSTVGYNSNYNYLNPLGGTPPLSINQNGRLTGMPTRLGQFVVGVCVSEYRNGVLIGEIKRDFQFNVVQCATNVQAIVPVVDTVDAFITNTTGVFVYQCQGFFVQFINQSINGTSYHWDFGDLTTLADTSRSFQPSYTYPDSGVYRVQLIVNPGYNCADTTAVLVKIYPTFDADFNFLSGCANQAVLFSDRSTTTYGNVTEWLWDFGDGIQSLDKNPNHLYQQGGNFTVTLSAVSDKGCRDSQAKTVTVHPMPQANFSFTPVCLNTPVTFTDNTTISSGSITSRSWLFNNNLINSASTFNHTFTNLTNFDVTLISSSSFGCADTVTQTITVHPLPVASVRPDTAICIGEAVQLFASGGIRYQWQPSASLNSDTIADPVATPTATTNYTITVIDVNSCRDDENVAITVNPLPPTNAGVDTYICEGDSYQLNGTGGISFIWSPGNLVSDSTIANPTTTPADTTTYFLTSFNQFGCKNMDSITLAVQHPINLTVSEDQDLCEGKSLVLTASGGLYYEWLPSGGQPNNTGPEYTVSPVVSTTYTVSISNDCFSASGSIDVTVHGLPFVDAGVDDSMIRDEFVFLKGTSTGIDNYWSPPAGLDDPQSLGTRASPFNTTTYTLTSVSEYGCEAIDSVKIDVRVVNLLLIPTAFSPNGDGVNDIYKIIKVLNVERLLDFKIFNRWGQIVFETTDINIGWDGTFKDERQELAVYVFYIKALNRDGEIITKEGNVTLVR